jgi:hypothetical protein
MIPLVGFEATFFSRLRLLGGQWEMSPFVFAKEVDYEGARAREMILHWAQRGLIELKAFDHRRNVWRASYEFTPESAVFTINHDVVKVELCAHGQGHAARLEQAHGSRKGPGHPA